MQSIPGFIQVDDYKGYSSIVRDAEGQTSVIVDPNRRLGCSMHVRRRFHQASNLGDKRAAFALQSFSEIYKVEEQAKVERLDAHARGLLSAEKSQPILRGFFDWVESIESSLGKTSTLAQAVAYAKHQRPYIERCLSDGRLEIDSGEVERRLREHLHRAQELSPRGLGRRCQAFGGWLHLGSKVPFVGHLYAWLLDRHHSKACWRMAGVATLRTEPLFDGLAIAA